MLFFEDLVAGYSRVLRDLRMVRRGMFVLPLLLSNGCSSESQEGENVGLVVGGLHATSLQSTANPVACWVKDDASTTPDAAFDAATQQVQGTLSQWERASGLHFAWQGRCAAPISGSYPGDIRILWNEKGRDTGFPIPGAGCTNPNGTQMTNPNSNWGGFPGTYPAQCRWNATFAVNQPINNYLHESGHTLGFLHEMARSDDLNSACGSSTPDDDQSLLTSYDVMSVMHYRYGPDCPAPGNLGSTGLSDLDKLGVEIAYPKGVVVPVSGRGGVAFGGGRAFRTDTGGSLLPDWYARGALGTVFAGVAWTVGASITHAIERPVSGNLGTSPLIATVDFEDPWGRARTGSIQFWTSNSAHTSVVMAALWD